MLYPFTVIADPSANDYAINPGSLMCFPFTLSAGQTLTLLIVHTAMGRQDFSLRCWVSRNNGGSEIVRQPYNAAHWAPARTPTERITICDEAIAHTVTADTVMAIPPGPYVANVLNLVNSPNSFAFLLTDAG